MNNTIRPGWSQHVDVWWMDCNTGIRVGPNHVNGKFNWQVPIGDGRFINGTGWKTIGEAMQVAEAMAKMYGEIKDEPAKTCEEHAEEIAKRFPNCLVEILIQNDRPKYAICVSNRYEDKPDQVSIMLIREKDMVEYHLTYLLERYQSGDITVFKLSPGYPTLRICAEVYE